MDFQPWLPLFALLGGAAGAAVINLGFGWWKARADRRDEHTRWLRDQRQVAYVDYLESTRRLFEWLTFKDLAVKETRDELLAHLGRVEMAMVRLLAPNDVRDAADALYRSLQFLMISKLPEEVDEVEGFLTEPEARNQYSAANEELLRLCREDLARQP